MKEIIKDILFIELQKLEQEMNSFADEVAIWKSYGEIKNSAGNLCLHVCGNLQHYIGSVLGNSGYVRNRDAEFSLKNLSKDLLLNEITKTNTVVGSTLEEMSDHDLQKIYKQDFLGKEVTTGYFLIHLIAHLDYHLGQINYLKKLVLNS